MKYLNYSEMKLRLEIFAPIIVVENTQCDIRNDVQFSRDGQVWQAATTFPSISINSSNSRLKVLKVYQLCLSLLETAYCCIQEFHISVYTFT